MSREIKFRAWDGEKFHYQENQYLTSFLRRFITSVNYEKGVLSEHESYLDSHLDDYLQQYTGLEDKNGAEVYEGDILVCKLNKPAVVVYFNYQASFKIKYSSGTMYDLVPDIDLLTVIGNIHENPELLEAINE